ncbi:hypothetical protein FQA39_LY07016 [Lamprigera yunnana]|nr:hypothetical protein FQA39_LY07016 [Lamprigera yunnana]
MVKIIGQCICSLITLLPLLPIYLTHEVVNETVEFYISDHYLPYKVEIRYAGKTCCNGLIIDEVSVLTAAHCLFEGPMLKDPQIMTVHVLNLKSNTSLVKKVQHIEIHHNYDVTSDNVTDDIGIIQVEEPFVLKRNFMEVIRLSNVISSRRSGCYVTDGTAKLNAGDGIVCDNRLVSIITENVICEDEMYLKYIPVLRYVLWIKNTQVRLHSLETITTTDRVIIMGFKIYLVIQLLMIVLNVYDV